MTYTNDCVLAYEGEGIDGEAIYGCAVCGRRIAFDRWEMPEISGCYGLEGRTYTV